MEKIKKVWAWLCGKYEQAAGYLAKVAVDKWLHFIAGMLVSACWAIWFPSADFVCFAPAVVIGGIKEGIDEAKYGRGDYADFAYTCAGGLLIQIIAWI